MSIKLSFPASTKALFLEVKIDVSWPFDASGSVSTDVFGDCMTLALTAVAVVSGLLVSHMCGGVGRFDALDVLVGRGIVLGILRQIADTEVLAQAEHPCRLS